MDDLKISELTPTSNKTDLEVAGAVGGQNKRYNLGQLLDQNTTHNQLPGLNDGEYIHLTSAEKASLDDLLSKGFEERENTFTEKNTFEKEVVSGVKDSLTNFTGGANTDIGLTIFESPKTGTLFVGARSTANADVRWYRKAVGGSWTEKNTPAFDPASGILYSYVVLPLRSGRVIIGTGFNDARLYISDDDGLTSSKNYDVGGGVFNSILSGIQLKKNGRIILGTGRDTGLGNLLWSEETDNADNQNVWNDIELNVRYDRIFALGEAPSGELVVGTGNDEDDAYLVVFADTDDLSTFTEYQIGPLDDLTRVTYLGLAENTWFICARTSSSGYKAYYTVDKGATIPELVPPSGYGFVSIKPSGTGRLYAIVRDLNSPSFLFSVTYCDNATVENLGSNSLEWKELDSGTSGDNISDLLEVGSHIVTVGASSGGATKITERDYNNTLTRSDGFFGAQRLSSSEDILEKGLPLPMKYEKKGELLRQENTFTEKNTFKKITVNESSVFNIRDFDAQALYDFGSGYGRVHAVYEAKTTGWWFVGLGNSTGQGDLYRSKDKGNFWELVDDTGYARCSALHSIVEADGSETLYSGYGSAVSPSFLSPLKRSTDNGDTWSTLSNFTVNDGDSVWDIDSDSQRRLYVASGKTTGTGLKLQYSDDPTVSFSTTTGLPAEEKVDRIYVDENDDILIGIGGATRIFVYRSTNRGVSASITNFPTTVNTTVYGFSKNPTKNVILLIAGATKAEVYITTDGGLNWSLRYDGSVDGYEAFFTIVHSPDGRAFLGCGLGPDEGNVLISKDDFDQDVEEFDIPSQYEFAYVSMITSDFQYIVCMGKDNGDADMFSASLYNFAVTDENIGGHFSNRIPKHKGIFYTAPTDFTGWFEGDWCYVKPWRCEAVYNGTTLVGFTEHADYSDYASSDLNPSQSAQSISNTANWEVLTIDTDPSSFTYTGALRISSSTGFWDNVLNRIPFGPNVRRNDTFAIRSTFTGETSTNNDRVQIRLAFYNSSNVFIFSIPLVDMTLRTGNVPQELENKTSFYAGVDIFNGGYARFEAQCKDGTGVDITNKGFFIERKAY